MKVWVHEAATDSIGIDLFPDMQERDYAESDAKEYERGDIDWSEETIEQGSTKIACPRPAHRRSSLTELSPLSPSCPSSGQEWTPVL